VAWVGVLGGLTAACALATWATIRFTGGDAFPSPSIGLFLVMCSKAKGPFV